MKPDDIAAYDQSRNFAGKAVRAMCYAPHTNIFFEMRGRALACCWNWRHPMGNVQTHTLDEMWAGAQAAMLRRALEGYDFSQGCNFCADQTQDGWTARTVMRGFDNFPVTAADPQWPQRMEFSISNSCNLECVMCDGIFSSSIRANREKLPPSRSVYSDEFIESLRKYLPHLQVAKFLGGEPFLITQYYRIWEMMVEVAPHVRSHITTNGTIFNPRVAKFMEKLNFAFAVSLDGATKKTVESIRVNANYDEQLVILKRLREYTRERKTDLGLTFCLMRQNWHELGEFCLFADEWECHVFINTVLKPPQYSINNLPAPELRKIVDVMEQQAGRLDSLLKRNHRVWFTEFDRLRRKCVRDEAACAPGLNGSGAARVGSSPR
jgi:sulfatase maturation enzyme AslB (radical SAM superfamily)